MLRTIISAYIGAFAIVGCAATIAVIDNARKRNAKVYTEDDLDEAWSDGFQCGYGVWNSEMNKKHSI